MAKLIPKFTDADATNKKGGEFKMMTHMNSKYVGLKSKNNHTEKYFKNQTTNNNKFGSVIKREQITSIALQNLVTTTEEDGELRGIYITRNLGNPLSSLTPDSRKLVKLSYFQQLSLDLEKLHKSGLYHGDIKDANLFLTEVNNNYMITASDIHDELNLDNPNEVKKGIYADKRRLLSVIIKMLDIFHRSPEEFDSFLNVYVKEEHHQLIKAFKKNVFFWNTKWEFSSNVNNHLPDISEIFIWNTSEQDNMVSNLAFEFTNEQ